MDVVDTARFFVGEVVAIACGAYGLVVALGDGSVLFAGISFALIGMSAWLATIRYNHQATAD